MPRCTLPEWIRKRLRIRVRALIFLVLVIGVGLGWIVESAQIQREAVTSIQRDGGYALYNWQGDGYLEWVDGISWQSRGKPGVLQRLVDRLGVDYVGHPVCVVLEKQGSSSAFRHIERFRHVTILDLHGSFVTDAGLAHLAGLTDLAFLSIGDRAYNCFGTFTRRGTARVTDAGMLHVKGLTKLTFLDLNGTQVGDAGLAPLADLTKLDVLRLEDTRITDTGLTHLANMTKLSELELNGTAVTDAGLVHLKPLIGLKYLGLRGTRITDAGVAHLELLTGLRTLDIRNTRITDAGRERLLQARPELYFYPDFDPVPDPDPNPTTFLLPF